MVDTNRDLIRLLLYLVELMNGSDENLIIKVINSHKSIRDETESE